MIWTAVSRIRSGLSKSHACLGSDADKINVFEMVSRSYACLGGHARKIKVFELVSKSGGDDA